ncbi:hypothetical protein PS15m_001659 [Mucor circinelloides]
MSNIDKSLEQENALEEFRNAWRQEVKEKHSHDKHPDEPSSSGKEKDTSHRNKDEEKAVADLIERTESLTTIEEAVPVTAMDHYVMAVDNERQGKLGKALEGYRRAFKLDPDIQYAYQKHYQRDILPKIQANQDKPKEHTEDFKHIVPLGKEYTAPSATRKDPLADLIEQFLNEDLSYIPKVDYKPVAIAKLPSEIMLHILQNLVLHSVSTIPYFALVCKKFFLLSRDPSIWQYACIRVFREPAMTLEQSKRFQTNYVQKYDGHWMRMFIDRPRIRYDGVYISTCNYVRPGASDTGWDKPIHFVTYYRYLRFFPNGTVLKHVTTNEPQQVVKLLQPGYNKKQCFHGRFLLEDESHITVVMKDKNLPREIFNMRLKIKTTHRGRHNKLIWDEYTSKCIEPQRDDFQYDLKQLKAFFFSPVRSFKVHYPDELDDDTVLDNETMMLMM